MTRRVVNGQRFLGSPDRKYRGPWEIDGRPVGRVEYRIAYERAFRGPSKEYRGTPIPRMSGLHARKRALDARRQWRGCEHDFEYREDTIGDYGVINGTYTERWLECAQCGDRRSATWEDRPAYEDDF